MTHTSRATRYVFAFCVSFLCSRLEPLYSTALGPDYSHLRFAHHFKGNRHTRLTVKVFSSLWPSEHLTLSKYRNRPVIVSLRRTVTWSLYVPQRLQCRLLRPVSSTTVISSYPICFNGTGRNAFCETRSSLESQVNEFSTIQGRTGGKSAVSTRSRSLFPYHT